MENLNTLHNEKTLQPSKTFYFSDLCRSFLSSAYVRWTTEHLEMEQFLLINNVEHCEKNDGHDFHRITFKTHITGISRASSCSVD